MALTPREAFKAGFLLRCAEAGLCPDPLIKRATVPLTPWGVAYDAAGRVATGVGNVASTGGTLAALTLLGAPVGLGMGAGYLAHKLKERPVSEQDVKDTEVADEYRRLARAARINARLRHLRSRVGTM